MGEAVVAAAEPRTRVGAISYEDWRAMRFFPRLEGLRAIAALLVVFQHARASWLWDRLEGWNGVTLFFVLSGFLITTLALREEDALGALRWRAFFVRRAFRIVPVYVASLGLYVAAMLLLGIGAAHRAVFLHAVPWYLSPFPEVPFFTRTHVVFSLAWSLGIEEKFYVFWPLVAFVLLRGRMRGRLGLALGLAFAAQLPLVVSGSGRALAPYTAILAGCVLAFCLHDRRTFRVASRLGTPSGLALSLAAVVVVHTLTNVWAPMRMAGGFRGTSPLYYPAYSFAAALLVGALALRAPGGGVFETRPLRFVGRVSYSFYLTHPLALAVVATAIPAGGVSLETLNLVAGVGAALVLAYGLHRTVERPLIRVGRRVADRQPKPATRARGLAAAAASAVLPR